MLPWGRAVFSSGHSEILDIATRIIKREEGRKPSTSRLYL
jgi:hypothetical protein